jgi:hypothetical protein
MNSNQLMKRSQKTLTSKPKRRHVAGRPIQHSAGIAPIDSVGCQHGRFSLLFERNCRDGT